MVLAFFVRSINHLLAWLKLYYLRCTQLTYSSVVVALATDLTRPKPELVLENALLRQQIAILQHQVKKKLYAARTTLASPPRQSSPALGTSPALATRLIRSLFRMLRQLKRHADNRDAAH